MENSCRSSVLLSILFQRKGAFFRAQNDKLGIKTKSSLCFRLRFLSAVSLSEHTKINFEAFFTTAIIFSSACTSVSSGALPVFTFNRQFSNDNFLFIFYFPSPHPLFFSFSYLLYPISIFWRGATLFNPF